MSCLVSVVIPVHNGERFLAEAVRSVREQGYPSLEIIIVDDGSTDHTPQIIAQLGDDVISERQPQRGPAGARNRGVSLARGELLAFLDADDLWPHGKLRAQVDRLLREPDLDIVLGRTQPIRSMGDGPPSTSEEPDSVIDVYLGSAIFRRGVFDRVGRFDETLPFSEDRDWFLRAREQNVRIAAMERVTLLYRRHPGSMTGDRRPRDYHFPRILKASLDRRRKLYGGQARSLRKLSDYADAGSPSSHEG